MIPDRMVQLLTNALPKKTIEHKLVRCGSQCFLELTHTDRDALAALGITADSLGPYLVSCMWDENHALEIGGYLVVDNLSMGKPAMGGIRMLPTVTPAEIHNLARGMTLKNAAATLPFGGGKCGIVAPTTISKNDRTEIIKGFAHLIARYKDIYNPGPDVGTTDDDMATIAIENGFDCTLSKPSSMGGTCIDLYGGAAGGVVTALTTVLEKFHLLKTLPQFKDVSIPHWSKLTLLIQGFGAVGAHVAKIALDHDKENKPKIIGISDKDGFLFSDSGLPLEKLFTLWEKHKTVISPFITEIQLQNLKTQGITFSNDPNKLLRESAFCFIPAAPIAHYMDITQDKGASIKMNEIGKWTIIIEGANTYSPDPVVKASRLTMERIAYKEKGILIVQDYLVNSGGVIFAAQERLIPTPRHLQLPISYLGNKEKVFEWIADHKEAFDQLSEKRAIAGKTMRDSAIRKNIIELLDTLAADPTILPGEAAEKISVRRIEQNEPCVIH